MLNQSRNPLPGAADTLLLRAALLEGDAAKAAYSEWRKTLDLDALDFGSQRVLPLLVENLRSHTIDDPLMERFRGVGRYAWYLNQTLMTAVRPALEGLNQSKIPFALLKGIAFVASIPGQLPLRAMTDIDLLVHPNDALRAMDVLEASGWRPYYGNFRFARQEVIERATSCDFQTGPHGHLDLHWFVREQNRWPDADAALWKQLIPVRLAGQQCHALSYEDQVLHAFMHGAPWNGTGTIRWVTDSTVIFRFAKASFDWSYFLQQCRGRKVVLQVRNCLQYLRRNLEIDIPDSVMAELDRTRVSLLDAAEYRLRARNPATLARPAAALVTFQDFRGSDRTMATGSTVGALRAWIKHSWHANSIIEALAMALLALRDRPPWLRTLIWRIWRDDARTTLPRARKPADLSEGPVDLSLSGDPKGILLYGWSDPESGGRWTNGQEAAVIIDVGFVERDLVVIFSMFPMIAPRAPTLRIEVWANHRRLPDWSFDARNAYAQERPLMIPASESRGRYLVLTFVIRDPISPKSLGISDDERRLGMFVQRVTFGEPARATTDSPPG